MDLCYRPLLSTDPLCPSDALRLGGTGPWFTHVEERRRGAAPMLREASALPGDWADAFTRPRRSVAGLTLDAPRIMGILNATPDSFSDGGQFDVENRAIAHARSMVAAGADLVDVGGESTRPGATEVSAVDEMARVLPLIEALAFDLGAPISIDTRKASVAAAALDAGAAMLNDVSGLEYDPSMAGLAAKRDAPICVMHSQGRPETMQDAPAYEDATLDVLTFLSERVERLEAAGLPRDRIVVDPGIGFGKTLEHNLELLRNLAVFHSLGCAILLGVSRKGFIGKISGETSAGARAPGSIAVALAAASQGVQIFRVHDVAETAQAFSLWRAMTGQAE